MVMRRSVKRRAEKNVSQERRGGGEGDNRSNERPRPRVQSAL